jgi:hypothetical protein
MIINTRAMLMYSKAWYVEAIKQTEMTLTNIKEATLLLSTKIECPRLFVKGARIIRPIIHLEISNTISDTPLSRAIFADVGTKAKKKDDNNTIATPFHLFLSNFVIIIFKVSLNTSRVEILFCIIVCRLSPL